MALIYEGTNIYYILFNFISWWPITFYYLLVNINGIFLGLCCLGCSFHIPVLSSKAITFCYWNLNKFWQNQYLQIKLVLLHAFGHVSFMNLTMCSNAICDIDTCVIPMTFGIQCLPYNTADMYPRMYTYVSRNFMAHLSSLKRFFFKKDYVFSLRCEVEAIVGHNTLSCSSRTRLVTCTTVSFSYKVC